MTSWLPATATVLALTGVASFFAYGGGDCTSCTAPSSATPAVITPVSVSEAEVESEPMMQEQEVFVLKFHADWCGKCKSLNPIYDAAAKEFAEKPVGFVILDVTNKEKRAESAQKMKELGLEDVWSKHEGRNGFMLVVDAETKASVKKLNAGTTKEQASEAITKALDA